MFNIKLKQHEITALEKLKNEAVSIGREKPF